MSFLFVAFVGSFFIRCFRGVQLVLPDILLIISYTVLVFVLVFIFDMKFFQVSRFVSLIVLQALALQFLKNSRFSCVGFVLNFLSATWRAPTTFLHSLLFQSLLNFS